MSKKQLQRDIKAQDGYILSDGTLSLQHLLPCAYDLMVGYELKTKLVQEIRELFGVEDPSFYNQYYNKFNLAEDRQEAAAELWERVSDYFMDLAPSDFIFGSHEGDGACIGWFISYED